MRQIITSGAPWEDLVGYSRATRVGHTLEISGTVAIDHNGNWMGGADPYKQTKYILEKIGIVLDEADFSFGEVIRTRIFVTDITMWQEIGRAHGEVFGAIKPATSMVEVSALISSEALLEIEVTAIKDDGAAQ